MIVMKNTAYQKNSFSLITKLFTVLFIILLSPSLLKAMEPSSTSDVQYDLSNIEEDELGAKHVEIEDALEPMNRQIFYFNKGLDELLIKPAAKVYDNVLPDWGKNR